MSDPHGTARVGDTVRTIDGESRSAFEADFFEGLGVVSGYRQATSERPLIRVHWTDGAETEALEMMLEVVTYNEDVTNPPERWERLKELREVYPAQPTFDYLPFPDPQPERVGFGPLDSDNHREWRRDKARWEAVHGVRPGNE